MRSRPRNLCQHLLLFFVWMSLAAHIPAFAQTSVQIHDVMANLPKSPCLGQSVSVSGIVVGVMSTGGFYISEPSGDWDSLVATAEGMPVFYPAGANPACAVVGNIVTVVGTVTNTTALTAADTPGTGLAPTSCTVTGTGIMTQAISLSSVLTSFGDALKYTGMAASNTTFYAVSPTGGTLDETNETVTSSGQFWATLSDNSATNNHLFRSAGIAGDEYAPSGTSSTVPTWSGNPQRILIDTATFGGTPVDITVGQGITCSVPSGIALGATKGIGLIDYTLGYARLLIFKTSVCTVTGTVAPTTSATADSTHFQVGTLDLNRFYSTTGATSGSVAISASAYSRRLAKAAQAIVNSLGSPDILSVQEVQDLTTLTDLASAANSLGGTSYQPYLIPSGDTGSLNLGFLVKSSTIDVDSVSQVGAADSYTASTGSATLWERPPLVLLAAVHRTGKSYPVTVINVHLTSRDNIGDATVGADVRAHRAAQALALSTLAQGYQTAGQNVIVNGNFNAFEVNDGYVDVLGIVDGSPAAASAVTTYQATATTGALTNFTTEVPANQRYNLIERGESESVEHILASATVTAANSASASLASYETSVVQPHFSADFAAVNANSTSTPAGLTPHDGQVVSFLIPAVPTTASISASALDFGSVSLGASVSKTVTITNTSGFTSTVTVSGIAISGVASSDYTTSNNCSTLADGATCTVTVTFAPTAVGTRTAALTVKTDSTSDPTLTASLTGIGVSSLSTSVSSLNFGNVDVGSSSAAQSFTVSNNTNVAVSLSSITVSGDYSETTTCGSTLPAMSSCTVAVVFTPTTTGTRTGSVVIRASSTGTATLTVALTGNGVDFSIAVAPTSDNVIAGLGVTPVATLMPLGGFDAAITVTCTTTAAASTCDPAIAAMTLSSTTTDKVAITTTSEYTVVGYGGSGGWSRTALLPVLLSVISGALLWRPRKHFGSGLRLALVVLLLTAMSSAVAGCSSKLPDRNSSYTAPGTYTYTLTATDGTLKHTATYTLTVRAK